MRAAHPPRIHLASAAICCRYCPLRLRSAHASIERGALLDADLDVLLGLLPGRLLAAERDRVTRALGLWARHTKFKDEAAEAATEVQAEGEMTKKKRKNKKRRKAQVARRGGKVARVAREGPPYCAAERAE